MSVRPGIIFWRRTFGGGRRGVSRVCVKESPAFGRRRLHTHTDLEMRSYAPKPSTERMVARSSKEFGAHEWRIPSLPWWKEHTDKGTWQPLLAGRNVVPWCAQPTCGQCLLPRCLGHPHSAYGALSACPTWWRPWCHLARQLWPTLLQLQWTPQATGQATRLEDVRRHSRRTCRGTAGKSSSSCTIPPKTEQTPPAVDDWPTEEAEAVWVLLAFGQGCSTQPMSPMWPGVQNSTLPSEPIPRPGLPACPMWSLVVFPSLLQCGNQLPHIVRLLSTKKTSCQGHQNFSLSRQNVHSFFLLLGVFEDRQSAVRIWEVMAGCGQTDFGQFCV